ncbi:hypothetical protein [Kitasatospora griseola]|uniref:hypothetical protein n=1 Tax=Kitasatospora griseola TaxID=2064 RepID=UPI00380EAF8C
MTGPPVSPVSTLPMVVAEAADLGGQSVSPVTALPVTDRAADRRAEELLEIARQAVAEADNKLTRAVAAAAIRGQQIPLSSDTLTQLREQQRKNQLVDADRS